MSDCTGGHKVMQFDTASQNKSVNIQCASSCRIIITSMRFPKQELDINQYLQVIDNLLKDEECHLFIDTNIISQLYKLNDAARTDFFTWVGTVANRFHIPNWTVHEYQKRYCSQKTEDYLTELNNKETVKKLENFSIFAKGYVSDSLLVGSEYQGHKDLLFAELDDIATKFRKINSAIKKNLSEHQNGDTKLSPVTCPLSPVDQAASFNLHIYADVQPDLFGASDVDKVFAHIDKMLSFSDSDEYVECLRQVRG